MNKKSNKFGVKSVVAGVLSAAIITAVPLYAYAAERRKGDVDNDGKITVKDAYAALRHSSRVSFISQDNFPYADMNDDGVITLADCIEIQRIVMGMNDEPTLVVPQQLTLQCGDRTDLDVKTVNNNNGNVTYSYIIDGAISNDGTGEPVLMLTNMGKIKAHHPGTSTVTVKTSTGLTAKCTVTVVNETTTKTVSVAGNNLRITKKLMTRNDCYNDEDDYNIQGIVVHSTATPGVSASQWYSMWNLSYKNGETDREVCVHAFLDDTGVYQYLPFEEVGWHVGGAANRSHIGFEICEPSGFYYSGNVISGYDVYAQQGYFDKIWTNATVFCAYLCREYNLSVDNIISHREANQLGLGTAHGDPDHWFKLHGKTMNDFRASVSALLRSSSGVSVSDEEYIEGLPNIYDDEQSVFESFGEVPQYDMFDVWGDNSRSLR
ncbi:MAG: N-acetylmuramoyl-L-alanine amidase [Lachnospiraceae bacterium]|nr:N-acetylmuramoyl-L-alanine amidase [Lachnospiraceae bacterium]